MGDNLQWPLFGGNYGSRERRIFNGIFSGQIKRLRAGQGGGVIWIWTLSERDRDKAIDGETGAG